MTNYDAMSNDDFDRILQQRLNDYGSPANLLDIPGVYDIFANYFTNEVLDDWTAEQETLSDMED